LELDFSSHINKVEQEQKRVVKASLEPLIKTELSQRCLLGIWRALVFSQIPSKERGSVNSFSLRGAPAMTSILKLQTLTSTAIPEADDLQFMSSTSVLCSGISVQCPAGGQPFSME
jgi:hypothetical protein